MGQGAVEVVPDAGLVLQVMRLAVAAVEPCEGAEQAGVALGRLDGVVRAEFIGVEVCRRGLRATM